MLITRRTTKKRARQTLTTSNVQEMQAQHYTIPLSPWRPGKLRGRSPSATRSPLQLEDEGGQCELQKVVKVP